MKSITFALLAALTSISFAADTPADIAADYREKAAAALTKINDTLQKATVPLMATLVKSGDTTGADLLREQLKAKLEGRAVPVPQPSAAALFKSYNTARAKALEPAQRAAIARIDAALASSDGKKLDVVTELGKVRAEIEAGKVEHAASKSFLRDHNIPKKWAYYLTSKYDKPHGYLFLKEDGTLSIDIPSPGTGTWLPTSDPSILAVDIKNAANIPEKTEIIIKGQEATIKRVTGMRYLKAD